MSLRHYLISILSPALLAGCSGQPDSNSNNVGRLSLDVTVDATLRDPVSGQLVAVASPGVPDPSAIRVSMTAESGEYSHTWPSLTDFPQQDLYYSGSYFIEASSDTGAEGFDRPSYSGSVTAVVEADRWLTWPLSLSLASSVFTVGFDPALTADFAQVCAYLHTTGRDYHRITAEETRPLYLTPGPTELYIELAAPDGTATRFKALEMSALPACIYECGLSLDLAGQDPVLTVSAPGASAEFTLTPEFLSAQPPVIGCTGWNPDAVLTVPEGELPEEPVRATVSAEGSALDHLYLSTSSAWLSSQSLPAVIDLLHLTPAEEELLGSLGLRTDLSASGGTVDFTDLIGHLVFLTDDEAMTSFSLLAEDIRGSVSNPMLLRVLTTAVDISVTSVGVAPVGATAAGLTVSTTAKGFASNVGIELLGADGRWTPAQILSVDPVGDSSYQLCFAVPDGNADLKARILYCEEVRAEFTVERVMPEFSLELDPFATYVMVRVTAEDESTVGNVVRKLMLYVDGRRGPVLVRNEQSGVIVLSGLEPGKSYSLTGTMMDHPDEADFTSPIRFVTEAATALPNGDFEDRKTGVVYDRLPSGGRYSQTLVAIFNWQNSESFSRQVPAKWANTNAKTFCTRAANHNTWYMQPSVYTVSDDVHSGEFAVCLRSVGFDLDGETIADYTQTGKPYLQYSPVVPRISCRAAGRLFLGSYSFSALGMEETYKDVVSWNVRPSSLNGFYKYPPSPDNPSDTGLAVIEVYGEVDGERLVIASATTCLPIANGYTAFTAPLSYSRFGVKATGMKVMFASSADIGTIAGETASVITTPDPVKGASLGSALWLDNVSLAY